MKRKTENFLVGENKRKTPDKDFQLLTDSKVERNWLEFPRDVMVVIFQKLGIVELITTAQLVCSRWRDITREPILFHHIRLAPLEPVVWDPIEPIYSFCGVDALKFALFAVDRSRGQLLSFSCDVMDPFSKQHLHHIADSSASSLKFLRLGYCPLVPLADIVQVVKKFRSLEELHIYDAMFPKGTIDEIGRSCTNLKCLRLKTSALQDYDPPSDQEAFSIAETMPNLRRLLLLRNTLTNVGLQAIIHGCPRLEYIFLRKCFNIDFQGDFLKQLDNRIQTIRFLKASPVNKYELHLNVSH